MNNRLSAADAEQFAGVSRATLMRFAQAGYFSVEEDASGDPRFLKKELCDLFNIDMASLPSEESGVPVETSRRDASASAKTEDSCGRSSLDYSPTTFTANAVSGYGEKTDTEHTEPAATAVDRATESEPSQADSEVLDAATQDEDEGEIEIIEPEEDFGFEAEESARLPEETEPAVRQLRTENQKLKRVIELQDQLLDSREAEIADLKSQRDWLQRRVEKGEENSEREQLLLISEMQMLSKLVAEQTRKRSPVVAALEWLGIREPAPAYTGNTIDYQAHKERREQDKQKEKAA